LCCYKPRFRKPATIVFRTVTVPEAHYRAAPDNRRSSSRPFANDRLSCDVYCQFPARTPDMLKFIVLAAILLAGYCVQGADSVLSKRASRLPSCRSKLMDAPTDWITMEDPCTEKMREQIQTEFVASMTYLAMGAYFAQDTVNRPGFAKMFFESASEERQHAIKIIGYLLMRGKLTSDVGQLIRDPQPLGSTYSSGADALKNALILEASVTRKITEMAKVCETEFEKVNATGHFERTMNDYHLVDWLTGDFLNEQYEGQRDLAGKLSTLNKMMESHGALGEFLFDKKLLNGNSV